MALSSGFIGRDAATFSVPGCDAAISQVERELDLGCNAASLLG